MWLYSLVQDKGYIHCYNFDSHISTHKKVTQKGRKKVKKKEIETMARKKASADLSFSSREMHAGGHGCRVRPTTKTHKKKQTDFYK